MLYSNVSFWRPKTIVPSAWLEHAPFGFWIVDALRPRLFVELGTHYGFSYLVFLQAIKTLGVKCACFAVDTWKGDEHSGFYDDSVLQALRQHNETMYEDFSELVQCSFDEAVHRFEPGSIDLLHIDGSHFYEDVKHDFATWRPKLSDRSVVLVHDTFVYSHSFGVHRFWQELSAEFPTFEFQHGHGLGVVGVGRDLPADIRELFSLNQDPKRAALMRDFYARLGDTVKLERDHAAMASALQAQKEEIESANRGLHETNSRWEKAKQELESANRELRQTNRELENEKAQCVAQLQQTVTTLGSVEEENRQHRQLRQQAQRDVADLKLELGKSRSVLQAEIERTRGALSRSDAELAALLNSGSWRITKPARKVGELLRRARASLRRRPGEANAVSELLVSSGLFDVQWYFNQYGDVRESEINFVKHYLSHGAAESRNPNPLFATRWYLDNNPDVAAAGQNPLVHFVTSGWREGRDPDPLFDTDWYLQTYPDVAASGVNPLLHYLRSGASEGRNPNPLFDTRWYLDKNPDVAADGQNPLAHFVTSGWREGRDPNPFFDTDWYLRTYPDVAATEINPVLHYLQSGASEGRNPGPDFDTDYYLAQNPDVVREGLNPLAHFLLKGRPSGRLARSANSSLASSGLFDAEWYLNQYGDVRASGTDPIDHYLSRGAAEDKSPNPLFDTRWYLANNPEVAAAGQNPLVHFVTSGWREGKDPNPFFDTDWYLRTYPDVAANEVNPLLHYLRSGAAEGRDPGPHFDTDQYCAQNPDVVRRGLNPLAHYLWKDTVPDRLAEPVIEAPPVEVDRSINELLESSGLFDAQWYLSQYGEVRESGIDPIDHYLSHGAAESKNPNPLFDTRWYLDNNPEVAMAGQNPLVHFVTSGWREGRDPNPFFDTDWYLRTYPDVAAIDVNPLLHYLLSGASEGRDPGPHFDTDQYVVQNPDVARDGLNPLAHCLLKERESGRLRLTPTASRASQMFSRQNPGLRRLRVYNVPNAPRRIVMVTDSINPGSLFGGVATAMIFSVLLATRLGARLRIVTRREKAIESNFDHILKSSGIACDVEVDFVLCPLSDYASPLDIGDQDVFVTTSWWTSWGVLQSVNADRVIYLLQEDERMFYPFGDERLLCEEVLATDSLTFVVNTKLLFDYLVSNGLDNLKSHGKWFEPSFPLSSFYYDKAQNGGRRNFLFYARPKNLRNLFYRGIDAIERAVQRGILDHEHWNFHLVGTELESLTFSGGIQPAIHQDLAWRDYARLLRETDLGLALMYTPHPSYPPLDLVACGAVAVTNTYGPKQSLDSYSRNIICANLDLIVDGIAAGAELACNDALRMHNYRNSGILRDWKASFEPVLDYIEQRLS